MAYKNDFFDSEIYKIKPSTGGEIFHGDIDNKSKISILVYKSGINDKNIELLQNILKAINISWQNDVIVRQFKENDYINISIIKNNDKPQYILSFGIDVDKFDVQFNLKKDEWIIFENYKLLLSASLNDLNNNRDLKLKLWNLIN